MVMLPVVAVAGCLSFHGHLGRAGWYNTRVLDRILIVFAAGSWLTLTVLVFALHGWELGLVAWFACVLIFVTLWAARR